SDYDSEHAAAEQDGKRYLYDFRTNDRRCRSDHLIHFCCLGLARRASYATWTGLATPGNEAGKALAFEKQLLIIPDTTSRFGLHPGRSLVMLIGAAYDRCTLNSPLS